MPWPMVSEKSFADQIRAPGAEIPKIHPSPNSASFKKRGKSWKTEIKGMVWPIRHNTVSLKYPLIPTKAMIKPGRKELRSFLTFKIFCIILHYKCNLGGENAYQGKD